MAYPDIEEWPIPTRNSHPQGMTFAPDGSLWFTEKANKIGVMPHPTP
jgi:streptogramin lyase